MTDYDWEMQERKYENDMAAIDLEVENANLRELVEDMLSCIEIRLVFGMPPTTDMYEQFANRASELGIEVEQ